MKNLKKIIVTILCLAVAWWLLTPHGTTFHYRLTLRVETPEGIKTGSSVVELTAIQYQKWHTLGMTDHRVDVRGEAVMVDLGERGILFAVLGHDGGKEDPYDLVFQLFPTKEPGFSYYKHLQAKRDVPFEKLPMLVHFRDINNPMTVEKVDPNDLEKTFGPGIKLISATIEMTDDSVTGNIEEKLVWLRALKGGYLDGGNTSRNAPLGLYGWNFKRGN